MSIYRIKMNGKVYEMEVELIEEGAPKTKPAAVEKPDKEQSAPVPVRTSPDAVKAPMPGSVIEIVSRTGQRVKEGEVVLIMETMKMENEIIAPKDGKIKEIYVKENDAVAAEAPLFLLED